MACRLSRALKTQPYIVIFPSDAHACVATERPFPRRRASEVELIPEELKEKYTPEQLRAWAHMIHCDLYEYPPDKRCVHVRLFCDMLLSSAKLICKMWNTDFSLWCTQETFVHLDVRSFSVR